MSFFIDEFGEFQPWIVIGFLILMVIGMFIILFVGIIAIDYPLEKKACKERAEQMNLDYTYGFWTDCMVRVEGRFVDVDNYLQVRNNVQ